MSNRAVVKGLVEVDPGFSALVEQMFGGVFDPEVIYKALYGADSLDVIADMERGRIEKMSPTGSDLGTLKPISSRSTLKSSAGLPRAQKGQIKPAKAMSPSTKTTSGSPSPKPKKKKTSSLMGASSSLMGKRDDTESVDVTYAGEFSKFDDDKRLAFGWSSIVKMDGQDVADRQGDVIDWQDLEDAAYAFMERSRAAGGMHRRGEDGEVHKVGDIVESFVVTPEKIEKMHLPDTTPLGWWIGMKVADDEAWSKVKKGEWAGFSIHGRGKRKALA